MHTEGTELLIWYGLAYMFFAAALNMYLDRRIESNQRSKSEAKRHENN